tara:strand:+ start:1107 stop:1766 length:660 start_codon:yes stop_codon:yes gene_type:complete
MSLFEEVEKARNPFGQNNKNDEVGSKPTYINQTSTLMNILNEAISEQQLPAKKAKECAEFRTKLGDCSWPLHQLQGKVSEFGWQKIVENAINGMIKTIRNSQPNGEWMLMDYDVKIDYATDGVERLFLVVKFVDIENTEELVYRNGVPITTTVNVNTSPIAPELVEALTSKNTDDGELKDLIKQLVVAMSAGALKNNAPASTDVESFADPDPSPVVFDD